MYTHVVGHAMGRARMYRHIPEGEKINIPPLLLGDQQLGTVVKNYYEDDNFCRNKQGELSLWHLHNLFTEANKQTYIDQFVDRAVNATDLTHNLYQDLSGHIPSWYLR